jgi:hypothetical protein
MGVRQGTLRSLCRASAHRAGSDLYAITRIPEILEIADYLTQSS